MSSSFVYEVHERSMWYTFPDGNTDTTFKTPSFEQLLLWHQLWRNLRNGSSSPPRRPIPEELIVIMMRFLGAVVPDEERTISIEKTIKVYSPSIDTTTAEWFHSKPIDQRAMSSIAQMRLETVSHDQGWTTDSNTKLWSWFEIALLDEKGNVKGGLRRLSDDVAAVQNYDMLMDDPDHKDLISNASRDSDRSVVFVSHRNDLASRSMRTYTGNMFGTDSELWEHVVEGDVISVRACAKFGAWGNYGYSASLRFWKWFEPIIF